MAAADAFDKVCDLPAEPQDQNAKSHFDPRENAADWKPWILAEVADQYAKLGNYDRAFFTFDASLAVFDERMRSNSWYVHRKAQTLADVADLHASLSQTDQAERIYREALSLMVEATKDTDSDDKASWADWSTRSDLFKRYAAWQKQSSRHTEAAAAYADAISSFEKKDEILSQERGHDSLTENEGYASLSYGEMRLLLAEELIVIGHSVGIEQHLQAALRFLNQATKVADKDAFKRDFLVERAQKLLSEQG